MAYDGSIKIGTNIDNKGIAAGIKQIKTSLTGLASAIGLAFGTAAVVNFGKESVKAASELSNALQGLQSIVEGQGRSFTEAKGFIQDYIADGLVPMADAVTAYKNLAARGYDDTQIQQTLIALKNSAAYGRQASLSMGEAIRSASEGIRNENSILVDNAGVTKNVSKMWDDYARSIGVGVQSLTQQQKIQAEVNGILEETRFQTGDASKVAQSYSGQVSQLVFNFQNLKVAIGNALVPIAQAVLPSLNAMITGLTEIVTLAGQVVSALFGMQAKKQKDVAFTASKAAKQENELAKATNAAAKAAKAAISGFDELNILQAETANPGELNTGANSTDANVLPAINDSDAGKISQKAQEIADKIRETIRNIRQALSDFAPLLSGIAAGFATAFGLKWVAGAVNKIKKLSGSSAILKGIAAAAGTINTNFKATGKLFPSLNSGLKTFRSNLSTTTKAMVGAAGAITAFVTLKSAIKEVTLGNMDLGTAMTNIIPILGAVGVALYAALGPWGLLAGGIAAAAGAIFGYSEAQKQMQEDFIKAEFFDDVGMSLGAFNDYLIAGQEESSMLRQHILNLSDSIKDNNKKIAESRAELELYQDKLSATGTLTKKDAEKMEESYKNLLKTMEENLEFNTNLVFEAFGKSSEKAAEKLGLDVGEMTRILTGFQKTFSDKADELETSMQPYWDKLKAGEILTPEDQAEFDRLLDYANELSTGVSESQVKLEQQIKDVAKINFESPEKALEQLDKIHETGTQLLEELDKHQDTAMTSIETLKKQATTMFEHGDLTESAYNQAMGMFSKYAAGITAGYESDKAEINKQLSGVTGAIQSELDRQISNIAAITPITVADRFKSAWRKINGEDPDMYKIVRENVEKSIGKPIRDKIDEMTQDFGIKADEELGGNIMQGLKEGLEDNTDQAVDAMGEAMGYINEEAKNKVKVHSASEVYYDLAGNMMLGLINGVHDNTHKTVNAFSSLFNAVLDKTDSFCSRFRTAINDALEGMRKAVNSTTISADGKISYSKMPPVKIPRLATGAVIPPRAQFLAVLGDQSHGRNLEAPESLIRQIVREEGGGNQEALLDRLDRLIAVAEAIDPQVTVNLGDREVAQAAQRGTRKLGYPIGGV